MRSDEDGGKKRKKNSPRTIVLRYQTLLTNGHPSNMQLKSVTSLVRAEHRNAATPRSEFKSPSDPRRLRRLTGC